VQGKQVQVDDQGLEGDVEVGQPGEGLGWRQGERERWKEGGEVRTVRTEGRFGG
jgi:hypothetical protein